MINDFRHNTHKIFPLIVLTFMGIISYSNTLNVPFVMDDLSTLQFYGHQSLSEILLNSGARRLANVTFALNYKIHGLKLPGYHIVNLAVHIMSSILLYEIVKSIITQFNLSQSTHAPAHDETISIDEFIPFAVAVLFVCHPLQTQAVTYIVQRYTSLATFFYLLTILLFIKVRIDYEKGAKLLWVCSFGCAVASTATLAINCKQIAATLPVMLLIIEVMVFNGRLVNLKFIKISLIVGLFSILSSLLLWNVTSIDEFIKLINAATSEDPRITRTTYLYTQFVVVVRYLRLLLIPVGQSIVHDSPHYEYVFAPPVIGSILIHMLILSSAVWLYFRSQCVFISRGTNDAALLQRLASLGIIWFYCAIVVESSIFPIRDEMFEHRVYLPSVGFFMAVTALTLLAFGEIRANWVKLWTILAVLSTLLCAMTFARNNVWNNKFQLWQEAVQRYPENSLALASLGDEYLILRMPEKTIQLYVRTIELGGEFQAFYLGIAMKALNLYEDRFTSGQEYMRPGGPLGTGTLAEGDEIKYKSVVFNTLALAYEHLGNFEQAVISYRRSLMANPEYNLAWFNYGLLLNRLGNKNDAIKSLLELRKIDPERARFMEDIILK